MMSHFKIVTPPRVVSQKVGQELRTYLAKCAASYNGKELKVLHPHLVSLQAHVLRFFPLQVLEEIVLFLFRNIGICQLALQ